MLRGEHQKSKASVINLSFQFLTVPALGFCLGRGICFEIGSKSSATALKKAADEGEVILTTLKCFQPFQTKYFLRARGLEEQQAAARAPLRSTCCMDCPPPPHLLCKIRSDKSKARENQDMTMKDNIRPSLLNYLPPFCHVSFTTELSAPTPHHPASITLPLNPQSPAFSPARPGGFPLNTWGVAPSLLFKCLKFSSVRTPPKSLLLPAPSQST